MVLYQKKQSRPLAGQLCLEIFYQAAICFGLFPPLISLNEIRGSSFSAIRLNTAQTFSHQVGSRI
jgi:membrane protein insertase Oxa1/YidC/SpoIIIJ